MSQNTKTILAAMAAVGLAFVLVLTVGFVLHKYFGAVPDTIFGSVMGLGIVAVTFALLRLFNGPLESDWPYWYRRLRPDSDRDARFRQLQEATAREVAAMRERKKQRIAELRADPARRQYGALVEANQEWSDLQIKYNEDATRTATCGHLQPVERAMRLAGIVPKLQVASWRENCKPLPKINADCCINELELRRQFSLADSVRYVEGYMPERAEHDNPWAELRCTACDSVIELVHSAHPNPITARFPKQA